MCLNEVLQLSKWDLKLLGGKATCWQSYSWSEDGVAHKYDHKAISWGTLQEEGIHFGHLIHPWGIASSELGLPLSLLHRVHFDSPHSWQGSQNNSEILRFQKKFTCSFVRDFTEDWSHSPLGLVYFVQDSAMVEFICSSVLVLASWVQLISPCS